MLKHELRKKYKNLRLELNESKISDLSLILANQALQIPIWDFFYFHIFLSIEEQKEIDTLPLITLLQGKDKNVVVPKVRGVNSMENYLLTDSTPFKKNKWGIPEPVDGIVIQEDKIDVVFIPLLAFDAMGNRVGYGKGFYDTFLGKCRTETVKIGLSFFSAETEPISDVHENDVKLDYCITPEKVYAF
ncbi:5-formyltetrahydrofolate cyclo-ligase [Flagellimonas zhangzhouensis]|uniref:5-formyltetrahydrofolate cyclo-ligase n=1 Tax=Flagellimonas zhangzhouensis TaxID=1073328 RepID=A0A1H2V6E8_9FLAO|nr:5-formyltetrahydrofolate cyclo-ligase [Allomuricauda zhangzhouensis]SDQ10348.1 5-formyltetrahydrofolate cyclo-ligase [Allomuricauda zhangzhouensis]SDW63908.1 5-formyltetrahydrofolate cyclo-ligase [Allomuricauda zhangzhouensis]